MLFNSNRLLKLNTKVVIVPYKYVNTIESVHNKYCTKKYVRRTTNVRMVFGGCGKELLKPLVDVINIMTLKAYLLMNKI